MTAVPRGVLSEADRWQMSRENNWPAPAYPDVPTTFFDLQAEARRLMAVAIEEMVEDSIREFWRRNMAYVSEVTR